MDSLIDLIDMRHRQCVTASERLGATYVEGEGVYIRLWAPYAPSAAIEWLDQGIFPLVKDGDGYYTGFFPKARAGWRYYYHLDGKRIPDPAARFQPQDIYGPSEVVARDYPWTDSAWRNIPFDQWVIYEIHTGVYSARHDFQGIIDDLPRLKMLGVTTLEIMPVAQAPGTRNWGYDGAFPHAVQHSYGGPAKLKALVNACHGAGLAIILDVVYNHIGPEGAVLSTCGPYTQDKYQTPWGNAINFDGPENDHVRRYYLQNAWDWLTEFHFDGLRLDAVHQIFDDSPLHFLEELARLAHLAEQEMQKPLVLIAESEKKNARLVAPLAEGGYGYHASWRDDLHHALHATLTGETEGYYEGFGGVAQLARIYRQGVAHGGPFPVAAKVSGNHAGRKNRLVVEAQNHDQIGNRPRGERLSALVDFEKLKLAAGCVLLSPFTPLIFMGEEWAARQPFTYFISHHDEELVEEVREGRKEEWAEFGQDGSVPDPARRETFERCVLSDKRMLSPQGLAMMAYYRELISLSKVFRHAGLDVAHDDEKNQIVLSYRLPKSTYHVVFSFHDEESPVIPPVKGSCLLDSACFAETGIRDVDARGRKISPWSVKIFQESRA